MKNIPLTKGKFAIIDDDDFKRVNKFKWCMGTHYPLKSEFIAGKHKNITLHRFIMKAKKGQILDHINGNPLDNRKENLRFCTNSQNQMNAWRKTENNTSIYKGVSKYQPKGRKKIKWHASITKDGKRKSLGYFDTQELAAHAYNQAAKELFGEFALFNDIYF